MIKQKSLIGSVLCGHDLDDLLIEGINHNKGDLITHISKFDGQDLFQKWLKLLRCIDEFINLKFALLPNDWKQIENLRIDILYDPKSFVILLDMIYKRFGNAVFERMKIFILMLTSMKLTYEKMNLSSMNFQNIKEAVDFCQSRRLYYVAYLSIIRIYAGGKEKIPFEELLCHFQPQIDNMSSITTALHAMIVNSCIDGYEAKATLLGLEFKFPYNQLDEFFLEPHTMSEVDILKYEKSKEEQYALTGVELNHLYSYAELEYTVNQAEKIFEGYGINNSTLLLEAKRMVIDLNGKFLEDYSIMFTEKEFKTFCSQYPHLNLYSKATDYFEAINERPAFFQYNGYYHSTVLLLIRYIENAVYGQLRTNRRYRIKSGFVFEKEVKALLEQYGFKATETKRIHQQEFDVICMKDGCAYNFQCKNNFLDINILSLQNIDIVKRQNKRLMKYYIKALDKENFRTKLVQEHFGVEHVENFVVSRFPIVTDNKRIIPFNKLENWLNGE